MAGILVVCYSRTGCARHVARALASELGADFDRVRARKPYDGVGGFLKGIYHAIRRAEPRVRWDRDPSRYDVVVIGAPVWAGRVAAPMRTYLAENARRMKTIAAFSVSGRGGLFQDFFGEIEQLSGNTVEARLTLSQADVLKGAFEGPTREFARVVRGLAAELPQPERSRKPAQLAGETRARAAAA